MLKVYAYAKCDTCRKALKWLDGHGIEYELLPIRETPPTPAELKRMLGHVNGNVRALFNTSGVDYKAMNLKDKLPTLTESKALALLAGNGNLVKRPFVMGDGVGLVGFKPDEWASVLH